MGGGDDERAVPVQPPPPTAGLQNLRLGFPCPLSPWVIFFAPCSSVPFFITFLPEQAAGQGKACKNVAFWPETYGTRSHTHAHTPQTHTLPPPHTYVQLNPLRPRLSQCTGHTLGLQAPCQERASTLRGTLAAVPAPSGGGGVRREGWAAVDAADCWRCAQVQRSTSRS